MGWQNYAEVLRLFQTPEDATHLKGRIKEGRTPENKAWYSIERLVPWARKRNPDNFGLAYASCMSPNKCMTDPMWERLEICYVLTMCKGTFENENN